MPSRFLRPIPLELYCFTDASAFVDNRERTPRRTASQLSESKRPPPLLADSDFSQETVQYRVGQRVVHKLYGQGKILSLSGFGVDLHMTVLFSDGVHRKMMAKFANFEHG
jgi:DNA helicase-2/ATP-dependent DNA helicase PcrA